MSASFTHLHVLRDLLGVLGHLAHDVVGVMVGEVELGDASLGGRLQGGGCRHQEASHPTRCADVCRHRHIGRQRKACHEGDEAHDCRGAVHRTDLSSAQSGQRRGR
jgi:hypothetical protein